LTVSALGLTPVVILVGCPFPLTLAELPGPLVDARRQSQATGGYPMVNDLTIPTRFIGCDVGKAQIVVFDSASEDVISLPKPLPRRSTGTASSSAKQPAVMKPCCSTPWSPPAAPCIVPMRAR
jgi:hypothetical protein